MTAVEAIVDGDSAENAFAKLQEQQSNLNTATAEPKAAAQPSNQAANQGTPPNPWAADPKVGK